MRLVEELRLQELRLVVLGQALIGHDLRTRPWPGFAALAAMFGRADAAADAILERFAELSRPFGTTLDRDGAVAIVRAE